MELAPCSKTEIRLHLRDEAKEYLEEDKLKVLPYSFVFYLG